MEKKGLEVIKMNQKEFEERCNFGRLAKNCDENKIEIELNDKGKLKKLKVYANAKDFKNGGLVKILKEKLR